jgi:hypothetical protein
LWTVARLAGLASRSARVARSRRGTPARGRLLVAKRDRLGRDVVAVALIERLVARRGASVVSAAGEGTGNGDDPSALLMRRLIDSFAEYEAALIATRTRGALAAKRRRGERVSRFAPYGFRFAVDGQTVEPAPAEQPVLARIHEARAAGLSLPRIARELNQGRVVHALRGAVALGVHPHCCAQGCLIPGCNRPVASRRSPSSSVRGPGWRSVRCRQAAWPAAPDHDPDDLARTAALNTRQSAAVLGVSHAAVYQARTVSKSIEPASRIAPQTDSSTRPFGDPSRRCLSTMALSRWVSVAPRSRGGA